MTTKRKRRGPRKATPKHLENAALHYLGRFASSAANLKRVLMRKVQRSAHFHGTDADEGRAMVERLVTRFARAGLIDDEGGGPGGPLIEREDEGHRSPTR